MAESFCSDGVRRLFIFSENERDFLGFGFIQLIAFQEGFGASGDCKSYCKTTVRCGKSTFDFVVF